jgi:hypothetical protein
VFCSVKYSNTMHISFTLHYNNLLELMFRRS